MHDAIEERVSRFTARDLKNLGRSSTGCPLRVIALIDFDAFYAQCETVRLGLPEAQPLAVQQWHALIAVNYPAKAAGVRRLMSPEDAKMVCPQIVLQHVATWREGDTSWAYRGNDVRQYMTSDKSALDPYRVQSRRAFELVKSMLPPTPIQRVEKASIDEIFLDLSAQVFHTICERNPELLVRMEDADLDRLLPPPLTSELEWGPDMVIDDAAEVEDHRADWDCIALQIGSEIVRDLRQRIYGDLHFTCSAGIAHNKVIAKLAAGHHKPNMQTVVRAQASLAFLSGYKITKIRGLGGKLGQQIIETFGTDDPAALLKVSLQQMRCSLGAESGAWVHNVIRGNEFSKVVERTLPQSMLAAKTFVPRAESLEQADNWLRILTGDLAGRLDEQDLMSIRRRPKTVVVHHAINGRFGPTRSKQTQIAPGAQLDAHLLFDLARKLLIQIAQEGETWPCLGISVGVSDFEDAVTGNQHITAFFTGGTAVDLPSRDGRQPFPDRTPEGRLLRSPSKRKREFRESDANEALAPAKQVKMKVYTSADTMTAHHRPYRPSMPQAHVEGPCTTVESHEAEFSYLCPKCDKHIHDLDVLEHLDWHFAKELEGD